MHDDACVRVTLDREGDHSAYCLCIEMDGFDPRYACAEFRFHIDCPQPLDCAVDSSCPPLTQVPQEINYLAKDYGSFRQLILDRMALTMPGWRERHVPDLGIALVEALAYTADYLSYYQDAVATEAYLETARQRISVRRHARLVDYRLHEGCNARALIALQTDTDRSLPLADLRFVVPPPEAADDATSGIISRKQLDEARDQGALIFEAMPRGGATTLDLVAANSTIHIYTWGDELCCLPRGSTRATLVDAKRTLKLAIGDLLIFAEALGPRTGNPADADPAHRHAVRLTSVEETEDPLYGVTLLEVRWDACDALPFDLCLSVRLPAPRCELLEDVALVHGNVVLVDHGERPREESWVVPGSLVYGCCTCEGSVVDVTRQPARDDHTLESTPLTFVEPITPHAPVSRLFERDPRKALPQLSLYGGPEGAELEWEARYDLLESQPDDRHFVVEIDDEGRAHLRTGNGTQGRQPERGDRFRANPRVGNGPVGNVGRDTIIWLATESQSLSGAGITLRNPLPASGGMAQESIAEAKRYAPGAFRAQPLRAVTAEDYAKFAAAVPGVQGAACMLEWTGSWYEANVAIDALGTETLEASLLRTVKGSLYPYRRIRHDLAVESARYVPLIIKLFVCVLPDFVDGQVEATLRDRFTSGVRRDGSPGFFHPDRLQLGAPVFVSAIIAEAQSVPGVSHVSIDEIARVDGGPLGEGLTTGVVPLGPREIAQVDNHPDFVEYGRIVFRMGGGR
jgi:hypothetical protein